MQQLISQNFTPPTPEITQHTFLRGVSAITTYSNLVNALNYNKTCIKITSFPYTTNYGKDVIFIRVPKHIGIIPDGNQRWAQNAGMEKKDGYRHGLMPGLELLKLARDAGVEEITY